MSGYNIIKMRKLYALLMFWFIPHVVLAAGQTTTLRQDIMGNYRNLASKAGLRNMDNSDKIAPLDIFGFYFNVTTGFAGLLFLIQVLHGGFLWMTASGNSDQVDTARQKITNGAIGAAIVFSAFILVTFVMTQLAIFTGIDEQGFGAVNNE